jgi:hypothetical protein
MFTVPDVLSRMFCKLEEVVPHAWPDVQGEKRRALAR